MVKVRRISILEVERSTTVRSVPRPYNLNFTIHTHGSSSQIRDPIPVVVRQLLRALHHSFSNLRYHTKTHMHNTPHTPTHTQLKAIQVVATKVATIKARARDTKRPPSL